MALDVLTSKDWAAVNFYRRVSDQYINQTPMGAGKNRPPVLTPRLEGYEAALRVGSYPRHLWEWLMDTAAMLHRLVREIDTVDWHMELGKSLRDVTPEDVTDGD